VSIINNTNGDLAANGDLIAYFPGQVFAGANAVGKAITSGSGAVDFTSGALTIGDTYDILVAYNSTAGTVTSTTVADVQFTANSTSLSTSTTFHAFNLVKLVGVSIGSIEGTTLGSNDVVHFNGA